MEVRSAANFLKKNVASVLSVDVSVGDTKIVPEWQER
jgi:hypothetical protein